MTEIVGYTYNTGTRELEAVYDRAEMVNRLLTAGATLEMIEELEPSMLGVVEQTPSHVEHRR